MDQVFIGTLTRLLGRICVGSWAMLLRADGSPNLSGFVCDVCGSRVETVGLKFEKTFVSVSRAWVEPRGQGCRVDGFHAIPTLA